MTGFLTIGSAANGATCEGGSLFTGVNGHEYCASNSKMNWWSAYTWCKAQGMKMPSLYDLCPTWDGAFNSEQCEKIGLGAVVWASAAYGSGNSFIYDDNEERIGVKGQTGGDI